MNELLSRHLFHVLHLHVYLLDIVWFLLNVSRKYAHIIVPVLDIY